MEWEINQLRMKILEEHMSKELNIRKEYEDLARCESDPRKRMKYNNNIKRSKEIFEGYLKEYHKLKSSENSRNQVGPSLLLNQECSILSKETTIKDNSTILNHPNIFTIGSIKLPYAVIICGWDKGHHEYCKDQIVSIADNTYKFKLPDEFAIGTVKGYNLSEFNTMLKPKCRLIRHNPEIAPGQLVFAFSKIDYSDYLISGERLDEPLPNDPNHTFREKYAQTKDLTNFEDSRLTNICGVGIFILTRDKKIIISKHSKNVDVYSNVRSYSASGTMDWSDSIHPFDEVARECFEEIGHEVDLENTFLYGFGIDLQKLYFQFSFFEKTRCSSQEIIDKSKLARDYYAEMEYIEAVPFELIEIINLLKNQRWEPAAAVGLVSLCTKEYGRYQVEKAIDPDYVRINEREGMTYEWNRRAQRKGVSAVMSARYPSYRCEQESQKYVNAVMDFIGNDINDKDVLEIGCGIGRLTKKLILKAKKLTCLDISQEMIDRNKAYLGALASKVDYFQEFAQDYSPNKTHQVIISSLVLIHNIDDDEFYKLVKKMSSCADEIFLFEHTDVACQVSPFTRIRSVTELESAFYEYEVTKRSEYKIFDDSISFLKLVRKCPNSCRNGILNEMDKEKNETVLNMDVSKDPLNRLYCQNILLN